MRIKTTFILICLGLFAATASAQLGKTNNEIPGYEFSASEGLRDITLLSTSKDAIPGIFGEKCANGCAFNRDWEMSFAYSNTIWSITQVENGEKVTYKVKPEFLDKIASITFRPKRPIVLPEDTLMPAGLTCSMATTTNAGQTFKSRLCTDRDQLTYVLHADNDPNGKYVKNQFVYIGYSISEKVHKSIMTPVERVPVESK